MRGAFNSANVYCANCEDIWESGGQIQTFLALVLDRDEWLDSRPI